MKKKLVLKYEWEVTFIVIIACMILAGLIAWAIKLDQDFIDSCTENGYSRYYCESQR